jgi:hypothetical protein
MTLGITSSQFITKMEKNALKSDPDVVGLSKEDFTKTACKETTISGTVKDFKDMGMTEFGLGWAGRVLLEANMEERKEIESIKGLLDSLSSSQMKMCKGGAERELKERDKKKLEYIG